MPSINELRRRLSELVPAQGPGSPSSAAVQEAVARLRELKQEVLRQLQEQRSALAAQGAAELAPPSIRALWDRQERQRARDLLETVEQRVGGLLDGRDEQTLDPWIELNREIDRRLEGLTRTMAGEHRQPATGNGAAGPARRRGATAADNDDELYATVGRAVRSGATAGAGFCTGCGQAVQTGDRFCRHCGHRLTPA